MSQPRWTTTDHSARWADNNVQARVDGCRPHQGFTDVCVRGTRWPEAQLLCFSLSPGEDSSVVAPSNWYVRGDDLVASYSPAANRPFHVQAYWRALTAQTPEVLAAIELILSVHTDQQECQSSIVAETTSPSRELTPLVELNDAVSLWRPDDTTFSYAQMFHPEDVADGSTRRDTGELTTFSHDLFSGNLEKGVIRRARLRGYFLPRAADEQLARTCFADFKADTPPLTT